MAQAPLLKIPGFCLALTKHSYGVFYFKVYYLFILSLFALSSEVLHSYTHAQQFNRSPSGNGRILGGKLFGIGVSFVNADGQRCVGKCLMALTFLTRNWNRLGWSQHNAVWAATRNNAQFNLFNLSNQQEK